MVGLPPLDASTRQRTRPSVRLRPRLRTPPARGGRAVLGLVLTASLALSGCTSGGSTPASGAPGSQVTAPGLTVSGEWPLTGLPAKGKAPRHPVMVVKIDNSEASDPQIGLSSADLVTEELVEGGATRLAVFFYSRVPRLVGPVRSMRATDIGIVKPAKAVLVASGGAPPTVRRVKDAGIKVFTEGAPGFRRDPGRRAPYNLFMNLDELAGTLKARTTVPSYLPFGSASDLPRGRPATGLSAVFSGGHTTRWTYADGTYKNENGFAARRDAFRADNVLVLRVKVGDAGYLDPAGNPVPETKLTGSGDALLLHGGRAVRGTWKKTLASTVSLTSRSGTLKVPAGHTWVELVPAKGGRVDLSR
jgi:hypothetical protein